MSADPRPRGGRFGQVLWVSRPLSWVNTAYPFGLAYLLANGRLDTRSAVGIVFFLIPYNLLMYGINDVFDYESDRLNPRKGGVEGALLDQRLHRQTLMLAVGVPVPFVFYLLAAGTPAAAVVLVFSLFAVVAYSAPGLRFKERPFLDSVTSSVHFLSPAVYGLVLADRPDIWTWRTGCMLGGYFAWGMASQAFGAVQDIVPDREGGLESVATVLGAARTVRFSMGLYALAGLLLAITGRWGALSGLLVLPYLWMTWPFRHLPDAEAARANRGWRRFLWVNYLVGFLLTQIVIVWWLTAR